MSKLDIWEVLRKIDSHDMSYYDNLPEQSKSGLVPIVTMRWLSGTTNNSQLITLNGIVNGLVFNLHKHPALLYKLMVIATPCSKKDYKWFSQKKKVTATKSEDILIRYLECSPREAKEFMKLYKPTDIIEMAEALGEPKDVIKGITTELLKK